MSGCLIFVFKFVVAMQAADVAGLVVSGNVTLVSFSLLEIGSAVMTDATNLPLMIIHVNFKLTLGATNFGTDLANTGKRYEHYYNRFELPFWIIQSMN